MPLRLYPTSVGNTVVANRFGPADQGAVVDVQGSDNVIALNDYQETAVRGWWPHDQGCVSLTQPTSGNTVFELDVSFPKKTLCEQVRDLGDNWVVGWDQQCEP